MKCDVSIANINLLSRECTCSSHMQVMIAITEALAVNCTKSNRDQGEELRDVEKQMVKK